MTAPKMKRVKQRASSPRTFNPRFSAKLTRSGLSDFGQVCRSPSKATRRFIVTASGCRWGNNFLWDRKQIQRRSSCQIRNLKLLAKSLLLGWMVTVYNRPVSTPAAVIRTATALRPTSNFGVGMPYAIRKIAGSNRVQVVKKDTGKVVARPANRQRAVKMIQAIYANEGK